MRQRRLSDTIAIAFLFGMFALGGIVSAAEFQKGTYASTQDGVKWTLKFDDKGKFATTRNDQLVVQSTYKVNKDQIEFTDEAGPMAAKGMPATYKWKFENKELTLTKVKDNVEGRVNGLTRNTWSWKGDPPR